MDFHLINVDGTIYPVKHMAEVGFYVDIDGQATSAPDQDNLLKILKERYDSVRPIPKREEG